MTHSVHYRCRYNVNPNLCVNEDTSQRHLLCNYFIQLNSLRVIRSMCMYHSTDSSNNAEMHVVIKKFARDKSLGTSDKRYRILVCLF